MIIVDKHNTDEIDFLAGATILVDKPLKWTSFDVVNKIRWQLRDHYKIKKIKVGHNGTLDPLATGLLMIFTGKNTKLIPNEENHDKSYVGKVKLGATTESLDTETEEIEIKPFDHVNEEAVLTQLNSFLGESMQEIPIYSAAKVNGKAMYKLARAGKAIKPKFKPVIFHKIEPLSIELPYIECDITCGKGTYIRAFAKDLGIKLNTSAYLYGLRRTAISNFSVENALSVDEICQRIKNKK